MHKSSVFSDIEPIRIEEEFREPASSIVVGYQLNPADQCPSILINPHALGMDLGYWSCGRSEYPRFHRGNDLSDLLFPYILYNQHLATSSRTLMGSVRQNGDSGKLKSFFSHIKNGHVLNRHLEILQTTSSKYMSS